MKGALQEFVEVCKEYLGSDPDALLWVMGYGLYVNAIDDIIDKDIPKDMTSREFMLKTFEFSEAIYSNILYLRGCYSQTKTSY